MSPFDWQKGKLKKCTQIHQNKSKSYLQSTSRNMWSTVYYSRNELCLIRMGLLFYLFFYFASNLYNCNLQFMSTNWRQRYTHIKFMYIWKLFILLYIYYCIFLGGGEGGEVGGFYLTIYVPSEKETVTWLACV